MVHNQLMMTRLDYDDFLSKADRGKGWLETLGSTQDRIEIELR